MEKKRCHLVWIAFVLSTKLLQYSSAINTQIPSKARFTAAPNISLILQFNKVWKPFLLSRVMKKH